MGGSDLNRQPRLASVRQTPLGWIRLARCIGCGHAGPLPAAALLRKHGEQALLQAALAGLRCTACRACGATTTMVRLCDRSCPRQRG